MHEGENRFLAIAGLLRRRGYILVAAVFVAVGFSAMLVIANTISYTATALVLFGNRDSGAGPPPYSPAPDGTWVDSEIAILRSDTMLLAVIEALDLIDDPEFGARPGLASRLVALVIPELLETPEGEAAIGQTLRHVRQAVSIGRREGTYLVAIEARAADAERAAVLANAIAEQHMAARSTYTDTPALIVSAASAPIRPNLPDTPIVFSAAGVVGLLLGLVLVLVREASSATVSGRRQLARASGVPVLGTVPRPQMLPGLPSLSQLLVLSPHSAYAEAIRHIRAGIDLHLDSEARTHRKGRGAVVMICSPVAGEGRTGIALSLARAYAGMDRRVLAIDCDLRHPSIHRHLDADPGYGLTEYLSGHRDGNALASLIVLDSETGMSAVLGSRASEGSTDHLLSGPAFRQLLDAATASFEIVILDTSPLLPVVDGLYLARHADAIVMVVKAFSTTASEIGTAIALLNETKKRETPVFAVLNQHDPLPSSQGRK